MIALVALLSCKRDAVESTETNNAEFEVDFLFENDGCKVYRFYDAGRYVYYTDCRGTASSSYRSGKITLDDEVTNSGRN